MDLSLDYVKMAREMKVALNDIIEDDLIVSPRSYGLLVQGEREIYIHDHTKLVLTNFFIFR
jgi:hypothetical protein